ncbi:isoprenyl transferase [Alloprevotella sp. OH1205_COT-284]|uniref:isoprenyl transferase n=1 Tax=Alloprevotella sp. OH1205_COT-284 TaxID=2491043 RepID=UPI000F5F798C|nr:isoprenyl transferase [Alloprevotella sp. OH1205_COT-284]RRD80811.1 isoprenyl transferase [Alloprevotella sp. OH1205_COT-284]
MIELDPHRIPRHIAIIMDGNGRWAKARGLDRTMGHQEGAATVRNITEAASDLGVKYLTLYTFSTENWNRPAPEVEALMALIIESLEEELFMKNNVRMRVIGDRGRLPDFVRKSLERCENNTARNTGMTMVLALSYSSKWEITEAVRTLAAKAAKGEIKPEEIDENAISETLATHFMPDPELLIRTGGECRLSNYLLWQSAYSELYFTDTFWPDFNPDCLKQAIADYQNRERRFGKTSEQVTEKA